VLRLVSRIESDIAAQHVASGTVMGTESELCSWYGVSPTTFRQAARILEASNIAAMRPGNNGGLVVYGYSLEGVARAASTYLEFVGADIADVAPLSTFAMALSVRIAAQRMTLEAADGLRVSLAEMKDAKSGFDRGLVLSHTFQRLVDAAGNPVLSFLREVSAHFLIDVTGFEARSRGQFERDARNASDIMTAAIEGDMPRLCQLMEDWSQPWRDVVKTPEHAVTLAPNDEPLPQTEATGGSRTLSAQLARRMLLEIRLQNWPVGERLGEEPDLLARYNVSRATFRQAVRLLEQYFAVETKRGRGGGLFVTSPDPARINNLSMAALVYQGAGRSHILESRPPMAGFAFDLCAERDTSAGKLFGARLRRVEEEPDPWLALGAVDSALGELSGSFFVKFTLQLLLLLQKGLRDDAPAPAPGRVNHLIGQCRRALEAGDTSRAKRAVVDLMVTATSLRSDEVAVEPSP
jgi:DNA-binding FadR family transcriptional regulator